MSKPRHSKLTRDRKKVVEALHTFCRKHRLTIEDAKIHFTDTYEEFVITIGVTGAYVVCPPIIKAEPHNPQHSWTEGETWERRG